MKKRIFILMLLFSSFIHFGTFEAEAASGTVNWTPTAPEPGDVVTITYDATGGPLDGFSDVKMYWYMSVMYNKNPYTAPSQSMWPSGTSIQNPIGPAHVITPMNDDGANQWSIDINWAYMPDNITFYFRSGSTTDDNDGNDWVIQAGLYGERLFVRHGGFTTPSITTTGETRHLLVEASDAATNWDVTVADKLDSPLSLSPSATYDAETGIWDLAITVPNDLKAGVYDLNYSATINSNHRYQIEYNALKVVEEYKKDYNFVIMSDPQHFRDGSYSGNKDAATGEGNLTTILQEINLINPEFVLLLGDVTEWTDEIAMENAKEWYIEYLDVPIYIIPGNHDEFELTGSTGNGEYGSGIGVFQRIFGPAYWKFSYGDHYFVGAFSDDQHMEAGSHPQAQTIIDFLDDSLTNIPASSSVEFFCMHHPLDQRYYGASEFVDITDHLLDLLNDNDIEYFLHGHMHNDAYSILDGTTHIGTDNAVGNPETSGFRVIEMSGDTMSRFSYGPVDLGNYYSASNPVHMVNITYSAENDGSYDGNTAYLFNGYNHSLLHAKATFKLLPAIAPMEYSTADGEIVESYIKDGIQTITVVTDIAATTNKSISLSQVDTTETSTTETSTSTSEESTSETSSSTPPPTTTFGFELYSLIPIMVAIPVLKKRKRK